MESFLEGDEPNSGKEKNLDFSRILDSSKPNAKLYLQAKERLRGRLVETGTQRTMPPVTNKPTFSASNIIPKRVIQGLPVLRSPEGAKLNQNAAEPYSHSFKYE